MMPPTTKTIRILHIVAAMSRGGVETWLMNVMRRIDRDRFQFDFCTSTQLTCDYDDEIRSLGGRIVPCELNRNLPRYFKNLKGIINSGRYDVIHAHAYNFSGVTLWMASKCGAKHRFAHLHTTGDGRPTTLVRKLYRKAMVRLVRSNATTVLGCTRGTFDAFFGQGVEHVPGGKVIYYGVDLDPFDGPVERIAVRRELGLSDATPLMIHVGRFIGAKNHHRLIEIFRLLSSTMQDIHLILVGDGGLMDAVRLQIAEHGLEDRVHFLGVRPDVPRLMKAADVMVMPSIRDGMPVTLIEATAAGLPVVISNLPGMREANDICCSGRLLEPDAPLQEWADAIQTELGSPRPEPALALARVRSSPFSSDQSAQNLERIYTERVLGTDPRVATP